MSADRNYQYLYSSFYPYYGKKKYFWYLNKMERKTLRTLLMRYYSYRFKDGDY